MDLPADILNQFSWYEISIQQDASENCFLILASTEEKAKLIYDIISVCPFKLEVNIDPVSKIYSITLIFRYNQNKDIEYTYNTGLTSETYSSLKWLTSGTVQFITTGTQSKKNPNHFFYTKPLLSLHVIYHPN